MKALAAVLLVLVFAMGCNSGSISGPVDDDGRAVNTAEYCYPDASPC
jgi:hypothetical protein